MATDKEVKAPTVADVLSISERVVLQHAMGLLQKSWRRAADAEPKHSEIRGIREKQIADAAALIQKLM